MKRYRLYISGEDVDAASGASFDALNPTTERSGPRMLSPAPKTSTTLSERPPRRSRTGLGAACHLPGVAG